MLKQIDVNALPLNETLYQGFDTGSLLHKKPDAHFQWLVDGIATACLSLWWNNTPDYNTKRTGLIGHFHCLTTNAGAELLAQAKNILFGKDVHWVIGPINSCSWFRYRFNLSSQPAPAFLMEPWQPPEQLAAFKKAGFQTIERYFSSKQTDIRFTDPRTDSARTRLKENGVIFRDIDHRQLDAELTQAHKLCLDCFADNLFYQPIDLNTFLALYKTPLSAVPSVFCKMAFLNDELVGFLFSYPDQQKLIAKTVAVKTSRQTAGLSVVMMDDIIQTAKTLELTEVIFALIHEGNSKAGNATTERGQPFRHYAVMGCQQ